MIRSSTTYERGSSYTGDVMTCEISGRVGSSRCGGDFPLLVVDLTVFIRKDPESQLRTLDVVRNVAPCKIASYKMLSL